MNRVEQIDLGTVHEVLRGVSGETDLERLIPAVMRADLATRKTVWIQRQRAPQSSGVLATAGGLVFAGALDRWFTAYDAGNGEPLWKIRLSDVPNSAPITYSVNGKQYIAVVVGYGGPQVATFPVLVPEIRMPAAPSSSIWVFELANQESTS